jgi:hypothetical protein
MILLIAVEIAKKKYKLRPRSERIVMGEQRNRRRASDKGGFPSGE